MPEVIDVCLVTWPNHPRRTEYLSRVWDSLQKYLTASHHQIRWLCSAESERDPTCCWCGDSLLQFCLQNGIALHWRTGKASLGAGMNAAVKLCTSPAYVVCQDDYHLEAQLDLSAPVDFMLRHREIDLLRLGYFTDRVNGTQFIGEIEPGFREIDMTCKWPYGDEPHMRRQDFVPWWGEYTEGGLHGKSERDMLAKLVRGSGRLAAMDRSYFGHIGAVAAVPESQDYRNRAIKRSDQ